MIKEQIGSTAEAAWVGTSNHHQTKAFGVAPLVLDTYGAWEKVISSISLDNLTSGSDFQVFFACVSFWSVVSFKSHPTYLSFCGKTWRNCHIIEIHRWNLCIPVKFSFSSELSWLMSVVDVLSLLKATPLVCLSMAKSEVIVISRWNTYLSNLSFLGSSSCSQVWNLKLSFIA